MPRRDLQALAHRACRFHRGLGIGKNSDKVVIRQMSASFA